MSRLSNLENAVGLLNLASAFNLDQILRVTDALAKEIADLQARLDALEKRVSPPFNLPGG